MKTIGNFPIQKLIVIGRFLFCLNLQLVYVFIDYSSTLLSLSWKQITQHNILQILNKIWRCFLIYIYILSSLNNVCALYNQEITNSMVGGSGILRLNYSTIPSLLYFLSFRVIYRYSLPHSCLYRCLYTHCGTCHDEKVKLWKEHFRTTRKS